MRLGTSPPWLTHPRSCHRALARLKESTHRLSMRPSVHCGARPHRRPEWARPTPPRQKAWSRDCWASPTMGVPAGRSLGDEWFSRVALCVLVAAPSDCGILAPSPGTRDGARAGLRRGDPLGRCQRGRLCMAVLRAAVLALGVKGLAPVELCQWTAAFVLRGHAGLAREAQPWINVHPCRSRYRRRTTVWRRRLLAHHRTLFNEAGRTGS